jgi:hypothetical protein
VRDGNWIGSAKAFEEDSPECREEGRPRQERSGEESGGQKGTAQAAGS